MKILIIRFSSIGDIVITSSVLRNIRKQYPNATIHFVTKPQFSSLLVNNPNLDHIHLLDNGILTLASELRKIKFDIIVDLHKNFRSFLLKIFCSSAKVFSFDKLNIEKWLLVNFNINRLPKIHIVDRYFEGIKDLGVKNDGLGLDFFISDKDFYDVQFHGLQENKFIVWVLGALQKTKQLPLSKIIETLKLEIVSKQKVILVGGKDELEIAEEILRKVNNPNVVSAVGKTTIGQSAYIISKSQGVITNDTGMMHISAALKKPIVSIWGNTIPEFGMYPYYGQEAISHSIIEVKDLSCRPCSKLGYSQCPKGHFKCMNDIDVAEIQQSVLRIINT